MGSRWENFASCHTSYHASMYSMGCCPLGPCWYQICHDTDVSDCGLCGQSVIKVKSTKQMIAAMCLIVSSTPFSAFRFKMYVSCSNGRFGEGQRKAEGGFLCHCTLTRCPPCGVTWLRSESLSLAARFTELRAAK